MKIYLDTNVYCRPFDDLSQAKILKEAIAASKIFSLPLSKLADLVISEILLVELSFIEEISKRDAVEDLITNTCSEAIKTTREVEKFADEIQLGCNINYADCLHLSSACHKGCVYFVTCDDKLTNKAVAIEEFLQRKGYSLRIRNPIDFLKEQEI